MPGLVRTKVREHPERRTVIECEREAQVLPRDCSDGSSKQAMQEERRSVRRGAAIRPDGPACLDVLDAKCRDEAEAALGSELKLEGVKRNLRQHLAQEAVQLRGGRKWVHSATLLTPSRRRQQ